MSIPNLFRCPISLDLFTDPVTLSTGQTYDRPCIEKWLADGNLTCPITMQRLNDASLLPNLTLRRLISEWLLAGPADNSSGPPRPTEPPMEFSLSTLKKNLQSRDTDSEIKLETLRKLRILSVESDTGKACLVQSGFFPLMLQLLLNSTDSDILDLALDCVLHLISPGGAHLNSLKMMLMEESNLAQLVLLLDQEEGCVKVQIKLCSLIETVASETQELCVIFGHSRRLLRVLASLLCQYSDTSTAAVGAISSICSLEANRESVIRDGGIDGLIDYLQGRSKDKPDKTSDLDNPSLLRTTPRVHRDLQEEVGIVPALATLEVLLQLEIGKKALLKKADGVCVLVRNVFRVSSSSSSSSSDDEGSDHAVGSLLAVCGGSRRARVEAVRCGVVTQLLMLIQSRCGPEVKIRARALLKMFKFMWGAEE